MTNGFLRLPDLVSLRLGGAALDANDEFFAAKENLLEPGRGVFIADKYTNQGKWMDGWQTRRRRTPGHDWCVFRLAVPGILRGVDVDTNHFRGDHPEACSIDGCLLPLGASVDAVLRAEWFSLCGITKLDGDRQNLIEIHDAPPASHLRLNIHPDGGVARFHAYGEPQVDWSALDGPDPIELAGAMRGGVVVECSDAFFSRPEYLLMPGPSSGVTDGWETKRRRDAGHDWCVARLGCRSRIESIIVETHHFKGNFPERCSLDIADASEHGVLESVAGGRWTPLCPETTLEGHQSHVLAPIGAAVGTHVRLNIFPDGGVSRLRLRGRPMPHAGGAAS